MKFPKRIRVRKPAKPTVRMVKKIAKQIVKHSEEVKAWEPTMATVGTTTVSSTPVNYNFNSAIAAGTSSFTRIGREIHAKSLEFSCTIDGGQNGTAFDDPYNVVRIIVYTAVDDNPLTAAATVDVNTIISKETFPNLAHVYSDKRYLLEVTAVDNVGGTGYANCAKLMHYKVNLKDVKLTYTASGTPEHTLFALFVSDSSVAPSPRIQGQLSFRYHE